VSGLSFSGCLTILLDEDLIAKSHHSPLEILNPGSNGDHLVIPNRLFIVTPEVGHHQQVTHLFEFMIGKASGSAKFRPPYLKPGQIACMVGNPHLIRFEVSDTNVKIEEVTGHVDRKRKVLSSADESRLDKNG
jgi:hypothetical protein